MENSAHPFDHQPPKDNTHYELVTGNEEWILFCKISQYIEIRVNALDFKSDAAYEVLQDYEDELNYTFNQGRCGQKSRLLGIADIADPSGTRTGEDEIVQPHDTVLYSRVSINEVNGSWKVELEFIQPEATDAHDNCYYNIAPQKVVQLEISTNLDDEDDDFFENVPESTEMILATRVMMAKRLMLESDFTSLPRDEQRHQLTYICNDMNNEIKTVKYTTEAEIACTRFYTVFDDMQDMQIPLEEFYTDQSHLDTTDRFAIRGKIERFVYAEIVNNPDIHFTHASDFSIGHGAPCLSVYDDQRKCRYYVVSDSIGPIEIID